MSESQIKDEREPPRPCENRPQNDDNLNDINNTSIEEDAKSGSAYFQEKEMEISHFRFPIDRNRNLGPFYANKAMKREEPSDREVNCKATFGPLPLFPPPHSLLRPELEHKLLQLPTSSCFDEDLVLSARLHHGHGHGGNKRKPHACQECGRSFTQSKDLIRHIRTHSGEKPYECTQCRRAFARHDYLIKHFRIHSGEKPYECSHCGKRFAQRGSLVSHTRVHSELKPPSYKCNQCGKKFNQYDALARHATMHIINPSGVEDNEAEGGPPTLVLKKCIQKPQFLLK